MSTAELPNLKELFNERDIGCAAVDIVGEKYVIHSQIYGEPTKEKLQTIRQISKMIDENFAQRGIHKLYTYAETDDQYRFNLFLGWTPNGKQIDPNVMGGRDFYEFEKDV